MTFRIHHAACRAIVLAAGLAASAFAAQAADLQIVQPHARATIAHQTSGAVYMTIENHGGKPDRLTAVATPVAASAAVHSMSMEGDVMKMREVDALAVPAGGKVALQPGGDYHIMLTGLKHPLKSGEHFPLALTFDHAGKLTVDVQVGAARIEPAHMDMH